MKRCRAIAVFILAGAGLASAAVADTQLADAAWPMFHHDARHSGLSPYLGPQTPDPKWVSQGSGWMNCTPTIGKKNAVFYSHEYWMDFDHPTFYYVHGSFWLEVVSAVRGSPAVGPDGLAFFGEENGSFWAVQADGDVEWSFGCDNASAPTIGDDYTIYVGSGSWVYALNRDGTVKWSFRLPHPLYGFFGSPAIGPGESTSRLTAPAGQPRHPSGSPVTIYAAASQSDGDDYTGCLYALNDDGSLKWTYEPGSGIDSSPAVGLDGTVYFGSGDGYLYAINPDGSLEWRYPTGASVLSSPAIGPDEAIYVGSDNGYLYAVNPDGTLKWRYETGDDIPSSPAIDRAGTICFCSRDGYLYAVNPDGSAKWEFEMAEPSDFSPAIGSDGAVYAACNGWDEGGGDGAGRAYWIYAIGPATRAHTYVDANAQGPVHDGVSWDTAFPTIQEAVESNPYPEEVWVAHGTYVENVVMREGVELYGGFLGAEPGGYETERDQRDFFANTTVIDGDRKGSCVIMARDARVEGFTATNGSGTGITNGGGFYCNGLGESGVIANNVICSNSVNSSGGGIYCIDSSPLVTCNIIFGNSAGDRAGGIRCYASSPTVTDNIIVWNSARYGGGMHCEEGSSPTVTNNTFYGNGATMLGGGMRCYASSPTLANNIVAGNSPYGIACAEGASPILAHNDFWQNTPGDYNGCGPGDGDVSVDPDFVNPDAGDYHLTGGSLCIDAGADDAPGLPDTDWEGEDRIADGIVDIGADEYLTHYTEAPDPEPECTGPLFGGSQGGFPAWVWFSIPLTPDCVIGSGCADPNSLLGFSCEGKLWCWDKYGKSAQVYQPPFADWDLATGDSYLLRLTDPVGRPSYDGLGPFTPRTFEFKLGKTGWTWIGKPGLTELTGEDFMDSIQVRYPSDDTGVYRTARQDCDASPDNWLVWGWAFFDTYLQATKTFTPYLPFGNRTCYPWIGYRVWAKVGTATSEDDPDQVTLIWPKNQ
jgi:outer membrane protein assembly factor BamB